ncbi:MAG TPA: hypothetical protein VKY92_08525 [Verrucomicrobiae bacterium]|nr:hypothetical protein [Verrucomicrobiae bacterium]
MSLKISATRVACRLVKRFNWLKKYGGFGRAAVIYTLNMSDTDLELLAVYARDKARMRSPKL